MKQNQSRHRHGPTVAALFRSKISQASINDPEFGEVMLKRNANSRSVKLRMLEDGSLSVTLPRYASIKHAQELIDSSRIQIRKWRAISVKKRTILNNGDRVGQSHTVKFTPSTLENITVNKQGLTIEVVHPNNIFHTDPKVQQALHPHLEKALQKEARSYLPRRLKYLAETHGFSYQKVRYGTQKGRWGSCSSRGTISLNVGLMMLDPELIDYVLIHELAHTRHMNHSPKFWAEVENCLPDYKLRRKRIKSQTPTI